MLRPSQLFDQHGQRCVSGQLAVDRNKPDVVNTHLLEFLGS